jgi:alpha-mannosidase
MVDRSDGVSRRKFLAAGAGTLGAAAVTPAFACDLLGIPGVGSAPAEKQRKVVHIIGHSHIDAAWLWPWRDGCDEALNTFRSALDRIKETPEFRYSHSSSAHYRWVERADPGMFDEIRQRVKEGRWEVVGGWPVEPDCNIPSTESFVRHCLYGKDYCRCSLGAEVKIGFNPDSFGHAAGLPTILKQAGYGYYVFMRPQEHEMKLPLLFWWEGPDGSRLLTLRIYQDYDASADRVAETAQNGFATGFDHAALFFGVGDHGGAVTKKQIADLLLMKKDQKLPELRWSTLHEFFAAIEASPAVASLPVVRGELQHHARGCYSTHGEGKFLNRRAERTLGQAETISLVASLSDGHGYPSLEYAESWWKVTFNQFHDMMAGTSLYSDYQDVRDSVGFACETAETSKVEALESMARRVDLSGVKEGVVFLFNPLPWARKTLVEYHTDKSPENDSPITHLAASDGTKIPVQWRPSASMSNFVPRISAWVDLPPCGYKVFELAHGEAPKPEAVSDSFKPSDVGLGISSCKAAEGTELLSASVGLVVIGDTSDTWAHGIARFRQEMGRPSLVSSTVIENGPVTKVTRQRARWQNSDIVLDIAQFAGIDVVELRFVIDWHEHEQMLKLEIPTALSTPKIFAKVPGAIIERQTNGEEEPYQDWLAVEGKIDGSVHTLGLVNAGTYSYDCMNGLLRTVLIRSAPFARHNPAQVPHNDNNAWQDQGRQERRFWLLAAKGSYTALHLDRRADELQTPAEYVMGSRHSGNESWERSFLEVSPSSVAVLAVKRAEKDDAIVIRLQERAGQVSEAALKSSPWGLDHKVALKPWEIKTLLAKSARGKRAEVKEVSLLEN